MCSLHDDAAPSPANDDRKPKLLGVGRDAENERALVLYFSAPLSDDAMRAIHDYLRGWKAGAP